MRIWKAEIKERGNDHILTPTYMGNVDRDFLIKFWGLNAPDVEWYKLIEIKEMKNKQERKGYFVADEGDGVLNVFSYYDFDENGYLIGYENEEGYHIDDYDILVEFSHFKDACDWIDRQ